MSKWLQKQVKNTNVIVENGCPKLALKYGVPFVNGSANAGCPGIMSPLGEQPLIELQWGSGYHNVDKTARFNQFHQALQALEVFGTEGFAEQYLQLPIHGRVMFAHITSVQKVIPAGDIFKAIAPYATIGLPLETIPYGKGGATVQMIFDQYIKPYVNNYLEPVIINEPKLVIVDEPKLVEENIYTEVVTQLIKAGELKEWKQGFKLLQEKSRTEIINQILESGADEGVINKLIGEIVDLDL